jgi:hypothetical protein
MNDPQGRQRLDDMPASLRYIIIFIKEVGFPIAVSIYMGYLAITEIPKMSKSLDANTSTMRALVDEVKTNSHQSERAFRRILGPRYPDE